MSSLVCIYNNATTETIGVCSMPLSTPQLAAYQALREGVGFVDLTPRSVLRIAGPGGGEFLHSFCTNDVRRLAPGDGCEAFVTSVQGKVLAFCGVYREVDRLTLETDGDGNRVLAAHLDKYLLADDVELIDDAGRVAELLVAGRQAADWLGEHFTGEPPRQPYQHLRGELHGLPATLRRVPWTPSAWLVELDAKDRLPMTDQLLQHGAVAADFDVWNALRIECGWPEPGIDVTDANLPQEVDRNDTAISFIKGCYLGQETVARLDALGHVNKILRGLKFTGESPPPAGTALNVDGKEAARITSSCWSPILQRPIALGYVRRGRETAGSSFEADGVGAVEVAGLPIAE
ncbi:MAG: glycine cleavage T C-terminal barrel domain-containing protein [Pirellulales bacterium]